MCFQKALGQFRLTHVCSSLTAVGVTCISY